MGFCQICRTYQESPYDCDCHRERYPCKTCDGTGTADPCPTCEGTGVEPNA